MPARSSAAYHAFVLTCVIALPVKAEHVRRMLPQALPQQQHRFRIERHRYRAPRLRLIGMNPRHPSYQIHLRPLQPGDVGRAQAGRESEARHVGEVLRQRGKQPLRFLPAQETNAPHRFLQHSNLGRTLQPLPLVDAFAQNRAQ